MTIRKLAAVFLIAVLIFGASSAFGTDYKTTLTLVLKNGAAVANTVYDEEYTLTIPESLTIMQTGWNSIGDMTVSYSGTNTGFDTSKKLVITAASTNTFKLAADGISDTISYALAVSADKTTTETTTFEFTAEEINTSGGTSKAIGVNVVDFSNNANGTYTDTITYTAVVQDAITWNEVDVSAVDAYEAQNGDLLTGEAPSNSHITVAAGAKIKLKNATINSIPNDESHKWAGITCNGDATIILEGTNAVKGGYDEYPGIYVPENATLTIKGEGSLTASSNGYGAGIGGGYELSCGNIVIEGGNITATGSNTAAGIGSGNYASCGDITITDGVTSVTATKGSIAPTSIGAGAGGLCGTVTIADGANVTQN